MNLPVFSEHVLGFAASSDSLNEMERSERSAALYELLSTKEGLEPGWNRVQARSPLAGGDGEDLHTFGLNSQNRLKQLAEEIRRGTYMPGPVKRFSIPKRSGKGHRKLGLLCVADRVVQSAMLELITPIMEAEFESSSHGYRRGRSVNLAANQISALRRDGWVHVVEADIAGFFDAVPHDQLLKDLEFHFPDSRMIGNLFDPWLDLSGEPGRGLVQGAPISPVLANLYLDHIDEEMVERGARIVRFADDFVLLTKSRGKAETILSEIGDVLEARGLELHPGKSGVTDFDRGFSFLGHHFLKGMVLQDRHEADISGWEQDLDRALAGTKSGGNIRFGSRQFRNRDFNEPEKLPSAPLPAAEPPPVKGNDVFARKGDGIRPLSPRTRALHLYGKGRVLAARDNSFVVREGSEEVWHCLADRVDRIDIGPNSRLTHDAIAHVIDSRTPLRLTDGHGRSIGWVEADRRHNSARHLAQARHIVDEKARMILARSFVRGKILNQRTVAMRWRNNARKAVAEDAQSPRAKFVSLADPLIKQLGVESRKLHKVQTIEGLLGIEGTTTKKFLQLFRKALLNWKFGKRTRRPAKDEVNIVLNWLSYLLQRDVEVLADRHGLHDGFGHLHSVGVDRATLSFDLMEEFRPLIVEAQTLSLLNSQELRGEHFYRPKHSDICRLTADGTEVVIRRYEEWMHRGRLGEGPSKERLNWRALIDRQVMRYIRHIDGSENYQPYLAKA